MSETYPPDLARIEVLANEALAAFPDPFRRPAGEVAVRVVDFPDEQALKDLGIESGYDLTGLYDGIPLTQKSVLDQQDRPDTIWLFRIPILDEWVERGDVSLESLVAHILTHELAHHFGWSDDDIAAIDRWWE